MTARPPWRESLASLRVPNFRIFTIANLAGTSGTWMQRIAQDWLVLELSGSVTAVGITVALQFAPMLFFGLFGGLIADRYSKRMLLMVTQSLAAALAATLAVLTLMQVVQVWEVWLISLLLGFVTVVDNPVRQVFVNELVGPRYLINAISVNSAVFQFSGLVGPALAGIMITAFGSGWSFALNAVSCVFIVIALTFLRKDKLFHTTPIPRAKGQLREGLVYIIAKPAIFWTMVMILVLSIFSFSVPVMLAGYADDVFAVGASGYGVFNALVAAGALTGALLSTRRVRSRLRGVIAMGGLMGAALIVTGLMEVQLTFSIALVVIGLFNLLFVTGANSLVQTSSNLGIRGRVMSVYVMVLLGGQAIGGPLTGWIVEHFGAQTGMIVAGTAPLLASIIISLALAQRHHLRLQWTVSRSESVLQIVPR